MRDVFIRPRQELPFLKPLGTIEFLNGKSTIPCLATEESFTVEQGERMATFKGGGVAVTMRTVGKGGVIYAAAHLGLAYLHAALQPPTVPNRSPHTHPVPTKFDANVQALLHVLLDFDSGNWNTWRRARALDQRIDTRLLEVPGGYIVPVANYEEKVGQKVALRIRTGKKIAKVSSAYHGELKFQQNSDHIGVLLPALGYGDVLRLEVAK
jgi:hypothetical protein